VRGGTGRPEYEVAFASFAPVKTNIFVADADGNNPKPLLANPDLDYNASFSLDGKWIVFTSERAGRAPLISIASIRMGQGCRN
jgi:Tol biopolymer transport system component